MAPLKITSRRSESSSNSFATRTRRGILLISEDLDEVLELSDRLLVTSRAPSCGVRGEKPQPRRDRPSHGRRELMGVSLRLERRMGAPIALRIAVPVLAAVGGLVLEGLSWR